jgi:group I intron endonuclease
MNQGIYKIINIQNDNFYIGSSVNLHRRKIRHFSELRNNKHNNKHLQNAWNKYGENCFVFVIVELVDKKEELHLVENKWLDGSVGKKYCYNLGRAAIAPMLGMCGELSPTWGYKHTKESREKIAAAGRGREISEETRAKRSAKLKGRIISQEQREQISKTLSGEGNYWHGKKRPDHGKKVSKPVEASAPNGKKIIYSSISKLRKELGLTPTTINRALKSGKQMTRGKMLGWSFKYVDPNLDL